MPQRRSAATPVGHTAQTVRPANSRRSLSRRTVIGVLYPTLKVEAQTIRYVEIGALFRSLRHMDPLDREILERVLDATFATVKGNHAQIDFDSDEG